MGSKRECSRPRRNALFASQHPFADIDAMAVIAGVSLRALRPKIAAGLPPSCVALLKMCWHEQPELRPNFPEIAVALKELVRHVKGS